MNIIIILDRSGSMASIKMTNKNDKSSKYCHVEDPNYVEPETVITTASTFLHSSSCTLCGFTGSPKELADHNCFANSDDTSNRFDPFEALDGILRAITEYGANSKAQERAEDYLYALRAYITGTER